jgi:protein ImuB
MLPRFELLVATAPVVDGDVRQALMREPIALAPLPGGRPVVGQVSVAAEAFAVAPGLPLGEAFARCPELKLVAPDPARAERAWEWVLTAVEGLGAEVESDPDRPGTLFFKSDGLEPLHRGFDGVLAAVRSAIGRPVRIGAGPTRFIAQLAARVSRPRSPRVIRTDIERRDFIAGAPVSRLAMHSPACGKLADDLEKLGISTLGEFALLRRVQIAQRFGRVGLTARDLIHGIEPPLRPRIPAQRLSETIELFDDAEPQGAQRGAMTADLQRALELLIERLLARPERGGRTLRGFMLSARFAEGGSWSVRGIMRTPTADAARIGMVALRRLAELPEAAASLTLTVDGFGPLDHETATLFGDDSDEERAARLRVAADQARQAAGSPEKVARVVRLDGDSRVPERRAALSPGPLPLARPRPVEVVADADGRPLHVGSRVTRSGLRPGSADIAMDVYGASAHVRRRGVEAERECWVVEDAWWTPRPVRRRYFELVLEGGACIVVFQDLSTRRWFEQAA